MPAPRTISTPLLAILTVVGAALALVGIAVAATSQSPGRLVVKVGTNRIYTRTELRPGATVVCHYQHHTLSVQAPSGTEEGAGTVWPKPGTTDRGLFYLNVTVVGKGYAVICGLGGYHSAVATVPLPGWLPGAERQALTTVFGGATPTHTSYIPYPHKIAVIFEFSHVVICGPCGGPTNASFPRGRVIRVSFDRRTHRLNGTMQFCESRGALPRRALCLRR